MAQGFRSPARDGSVSDPGEPPRDFGPLLLRWLVDYLKEIKQRISGRLTISPRVNHGWTGNIDGEWIKIDIPAGGGEFILPHGLKRVPISFTVRFITAPIVLYAPANDTAVWNENFVTLIADSSLANPAVAWVLLE